MRNAAAPFLLALAALAACADDPTGSATYSGSGGAGGGAGDGGASGDGGRDAGGTTSSPSSGTPTSSSGPTNSGSSTAEGNGGAGAGGGGAGGAGSSAGGAGGAGSGGGELSCPGQFECSDGDCVSYARFCDGEDDCADGQDEDIDACAGFIDGLGVCASQIAFTGNPGLNLCAGASCCGQFNACTGQGADVDACIECFGDGGGELCDAALACVDAECPGGGSAICDSTLTTADLDRDACLSTACCEEHRDCVGSGSVDEVAACVDCFVEGGGELCDAAIACGEDSCPYVEPAGVCESGLTSNDAEDDLCLTDACCDAFTACTAGASDVDACIACIDAGGGALCDEALDCAAASCP